MFQYCFLLMILLFPVLYIAYNIISKTQRFKIPPGPLGFPVVGHLYLLKPRLHRYLHRISERYGPFFTLRFGFRRVVVISSYPLVKECFTGRNDIVLSNRPSFTTNKYISYNHTTIGTSPYNDHWKNVRRISSVEILSPHRLQSFYHIRRDEIHRLLKSLARDNTTNGDNKLNSFKEVELEPLFSDLMTNTLVRMVTGKRYYGDDVVNKEEAETFKSLIKDAFIQTGVTYPSDYLPFLKFFGNKYEEKVKSIGKSVDKVLQRLLDECRKDKEGNTMINHLMSLQDQEPEYYNNVTIKGLMMSMILPGSDTSSITMAWVMTHVLKHPDVLKKARAEIDEKIGQDRLIEEQDLSDLPYLQNIVTETFRLTPVVPVSVSRQASEDIKIGGYDVPRGTIVLINTWAIHRDPELWNDPEKFYPERFNANKCKTDESLDNIRTLMLFGNGRRVCPGAGLAQKMITWTVGALVQCFDWERVNGEEIDTEEATGAVMRKLKPLRGMCRPRPLMSKLVT
ncbi:hypothetical protein AALP_AA4G068300 [Arabis alpina]|uniref:Cytochrome p450 n=1 Tax=Arabis alpina TaxID=50452 RepID=A0A087H1M5_ARAAL|nr:hypothetical protein AALP_AA4G068300 [Arabis alpina]